MRGRKTVLEIVRPQATVAMILGASNLRPAVISRKNPCGPQSKTLLLGNKTVSGDSYHFGGRKCP